MEYTLRDFITNLEHCGNAGDINMQSDKALELINECLPRNMMVKKIFHEKREGDSILDTA